MRKKAKMIACRNCDTPMDKGAKVCPSCGAKNKKPFYKRGWFILLMVVVVIGAISSTGGNDNKGEKFKWNDMILSSVLPEPQSNVGIVIANYDDSLLIEIHKISSNDYKDYVSKCQFAGFTVESDISEMSFDAYNEAGYKLSLWYNSSDEKLNLSLDAPMEMGTLSWPVSEIASFLPKPESDVGKISTESSDRLYVYVGDTSADDYSNYVEACFEKGFSVDYEKGETYFYAENPEGYQLAVIYQGNKMMSIEIEGPEETTDANISETAESQEVESEDDETVPADEPVATPEDAELIDGMRPEFKEAMDSYEAFYDEYCEFIKKYEENPSDLTLIAKYTEMMAGLVDMDKKFEAWDDGDLNDAELNYYIAVNNRVAQKLLEVA